MSSNGGRGPATIGVYTRTERAMLDLFEQGAPVTIDQLKTCLYDPDGGADDTVRVHITYLRHRIPRHLRIVKVPGRARTFMLMRITRSSDDQDS